MLDAYTIKKMLPRLIIAVIAIQLSIYVCQFLVDISNVAGQGIRGLFSAAIPGSASGVDPQILAEGLAGSLGAGAGIAGTLAGILGGIAGLILFPALALALAFIILPVIFSVLITLVLRQIVIIAMVIISPLAMLAWVLPNTEKYAQQWFSILLRTLMIFPIIQGLYVISIIVGVAAQTSVAGASTSAPADLVSSVIAIGAIIAPLAAIPFTFKFSGAALNAINGAVSKASNRLAAPGKKWATEKGMEQMSKSRHGTRFNNRFLNRAGQIATGRFGITEKGRGKRSAAHVQHGLHGAKELNEAGINNHHALNALAANQGDNQKAKSYLLRQKNRGAIDEDEYRIATSQLGLAKSVKLTHEGMASSAAIAAAAQGRVSSDAIEGLNGIHDNSVKASTLRQIQESAKGQGQFEAGLGTGIDEHGNAFGWNSRDANGRMHGREKFVRDLDQMSQGDMARMKSSTGDLMGDVLPSAMVEAQQNGQMDRLSHLAEQAGVIDMYGSTRAKDALHQGRRGQDGNLGSQGLDNIPGILDATVTHRAETGQSTKYDEEHGLLTKAVTIGTKAVKVRDLLRDRGRPPETPAGGAGGGAPDPGTPAGGLPPPTI